ncbi:hypothetical protein JYU34_015511 [Plutella xylostella]|uniref:Uncharacterized protein n=1 Tax=Plutella xylostella TaxID=51655 RepID=A0ABQ7Q789_PLUXY|nr:hypothetical protein JYU34_015511 [Plutella xylostella]
MHETKKKQTERFSLKTSIPISKIDMKCVNTATDATFQTNLTKKTPVPFNPAFQTTKDIANNNLKTRVEIQSNVVIKNAVNKEPEIKPEEPIKQIVRHTPNNSISTLINAAEALNSSDSPFWKTDKNPESLNKETETFAKPITTNRPIFNPMNAEPKLNYSNKPPDGFSEQKNQIVFIQNKNPSNPKMLLTISQPSQPQPQVILQRTNCESKNMQAPSRLSSLTKKCKEELISENSTSSKVVALKRLHQENCDENDFENLITENQIYGNKIVVKEKTQGTLQEQEIKKNSTKIMNEKSNQTSDTKNVVLQPNFVYLSNLQFPANLMMIKNSAKVNQAINEQIKINCKAEGNENKFLNENNVIGSNDMAINTQKAMKPQISVTKEVHVLKSSNNVIQTITPKNNKTDLVFQTNQKVIMNSQILYQVPMIVDTHGITSNEQKINGQTYLNRDYTKFLAQNKKDNNMSRINENTKCNEKLYIACPYQMDSKLQPKIVITNLRPKIAKVEEVSTLDLYEKRKRLRRLKHLTPREQKTDFKKERTDIPRNIITPDKMKAEICKEFTKTQVMDYDQTSESESDGEESELKEYESIIKEFSPPSIVEDPTQKKSFLSQFRLGTHEECKEKLLDRQERSLRRDAVASAYISVGRIDRLSRDPPGQPATEAEAGPRPPPAGAATWSHEPEPSATVQKKQMFLSHLRLVQVSPRHRDDYEKIWHEIVKERRRRNGDPQPPPVSTPAASTPGNMTMDTTDHLQILTDIKNSVHENNNLIKRRLDETQDSSSADSIHTLAEKNFSELSKLSKMADRSVKLFSGQDMKKRDVNPGFDSENMQRLHQKPCQSYANINIPNISKIISLKSCAEASVVASAPATSMDEPRSCAAGPGGGTDGGTCGGPDRGPGEAGAEDPEPRASAFTWPGVDAVVRSFKEFEAVRKRELSSLHRRNTYLRVESARATRTAAREAELARALATERASLATDEHSLRVSIQRIMTSVEAVRSASLH